MKVYILVEDMHEEQERILAKQNIAVPERNETAVIIKELLGILVDGNLTAEQAKDAWDHYNESHGYRQKCAGGNGIPSYDKLPRWLRDNIEGLENGKTASFDHHPELNIACVAIELKDCFMNYVSKTERDQISNELHEMLRRAIASVYAEYINRVSQLSLNEPAAQGKASNDH